MGIRFGWHFPAVVLLLWPFASAQQERRVVVAKPDDLEVRRVALQLRVSEQRVLNARTALEAATALVERLPVDRLSRVSQLGSHWLRIDPLRAPPPLENLVAGLRRRAAAADDPDAYRRISSAALALVRQLDQIEGGTSRAEALLADWPEGPAGTASSWTESARLRTQQEQLRRLAATDPMAAWERLRQTDPAGDDWQSRARLLPALSSLGHDELTGEVADQLLTAVENRDPRQRMAILQSVGRIVAGVDPDRFDQVLRLMVESSRALEEPTTGKRRVLASTGNPELELSQADRQMLDFMRSLQKQPTALLKVAEVSPNLAAWIEAEGGVDRVLSGASGRGLTEERATMIRTAARARGADAREVADQILASEDGREIQVLAGAATRYCSRPADAEAVLAAAASQSRILEAREAASLLGGLIRTSVRCLGTLHDRVAAETESLVDELRGSEAGTQETDRDRLAADQLELSLVTSEVVFEFESARSAIEALEDESLQFQAWLQAVGTLTRQ